jgi:hypothetical protein
MSSVGKAPTAIFHINTFYGFGWTCRVRSRWRLASSCPWGPTIEGKRWLILLTHKMDYFLPASHRCELLFSLPWEWLCKSYLWMHFGCRPLCCEACFPVHISCRIGKPLRPPARKQDIIPNLSLTKKMVRVQIFIYSNTMQKEKGIYLIWSCDATKANWNEN